MVILLLCTVICVINVGSSRNAAACDLLHVVATSNSHVIDLSMLFTVGLECNLSFPHRLIQIYLIHSDIELEKRRARLINGLSLLEKHE